MSAGYKVRSIKPLEEDQALKQGAEMIGEGFVLAVSTGWLLYEYNSSATKTAEKDEIRRAAAKAERDELQAKLHALDVRLLALEDMVKKNNASLLSLGRSNYIAPPAKEIVPIDGVDGREQEGVSVSATQPSRDDKGTTSVIASGRGGWLRWPPW
jgi:hypothetical protein